MFPSAAPAGNKTTNYTNSAAYNWSHWAGENQIPLGVEFSHLIELDTDFTGLDSAMTKEKAQPIFTGCAFRVL
jgi:hypothetical protein